MARLALALIGAVLLPEATRSAEIVGRDTLIEKLSPPAGGAKIRGLMVMPSVDLDVKFEFDSARLTDEAVRQLTELGAALASETLAAYRFEIAGHTDAVGTAAYNQKLSERRSEAVRDFLGTRFGINSGRLVTSGWGFQRLKVAEAPTSGENRRVEIVNLGK